MESVEIRNPKSEIIVLLALLVAALFSTWASAFIDPERPASWLISECKAIAALKVTAVEKDSATFAVVKALKGEVKPKEIIIRWTATQKPPVEKDAIGAPAVLLVPKDDDDPTHIQISPEYLSLKPIAGKDGQYDFIRLNGFVKGSFNGESADLIRLIEDTVAGKAYFPIWADTAFAPAVKIGDLPDVTTAIAVGDVDGDGKLEVVAATPKGLVAFSRGADGKFTLHPIKGIDGARIIQLADADGDGRLDVLAETGLYLNKGDWQFEAAYDMTGRKWTAASFCHIPGQPPPAIVAIGERQFRALARDQSGKWRDVSASAGLDSVRDPVDATNVACLDRMSVVWLTPKAMVRNDAGTAKQGGVLSLVKDGMDGLKNARLCQRDLDGDGLLDVAMAGDGVLRLFGGRQDGKLTEFADYLGDVRKMFQPMRGCGGVICEDFNNDGLIDILVWSKSQKLSLVMNRGYHNLREATELFDLPSAMKGIDEIQAVAVADIGEHGSLDLIVASGKSVYLLANMFDKKPEECNDRPRNPLLTVRAPGRFGALVTVLDKDSKPLAAQRIGSGPAADTVYFGYRSPLPAAVTLTTADGKTIRQAVAAEALARPVIFK